MSEQSYYTTGTSNEFLRDKGFDSRWTVSEAPKKKDGWEEVLIKGAKGKKKANASEKRARAAKVSEEVLKNADAVRVDLDGGKLLSMIEKDTQRRENGPKGPQEPKDNGPRMMSVGEANGGTGGGGGEGSAKAKKKIAAPEAKKPKPPPQVKLTAQQLNAKLADTMAKHMDAPDMQLLSLAEHFEEAYKAVPNDAVVWTPSDHSSSIGAWEGMYLALLKDATAQTAAEWVSNMPPSEIAAFLDFLVGTALPGGGLAGRGGDKTYAGLRALIQLILQRVGKSNWHQGGAVLSRHFLRSEGRIAGSSVPALLWMIAQLGQRDSEGALRCWFSTMIPVVEHERAGGGKLAAQAVRVLQELLGKASGSGKELPLEGLVKLMNLVYPLRAADGKETGGGGGSGKTGAGRNTAAIEGIAKSWQGIVSCSPVGANGGKSAFQVVPAMLPLVASEAHSPELRAAATDIMVRCFKSDPQGLSVFVKMHESSIKGSIQVVDALSARWSNLRVPKGEIVKAMRQLSAACETALEADKSRKEVSAEQAAARKGKLAKRSQKQEDIMTLKGSADKLASNAGFSYLAFFTEITFVVGVGAAAFACMQPGCSSALQPIYQKLAESLPEGRFPNDVTTETVSTVVRRCTEVGVSRITEKIAEFQ